MDEQAKKEFWYDGLPEELRNLAKVMFTEKENEVGMAYLHEGKSDVRNLNLLAKYDPEYIKILRDRAVELQNETGLITRVLTFYEVVKTCKK
jgi:hypothetical protein